MISAYRSGMCDILLDVADAYVYETEENCDFQIIGSPIMSVPAGFPVVEAGMWSWCFD